MLLLPCSWLSDFRPISVTPILSRILEKYVVSRWIRPAISVEQLADQFGFRPTGSSRSKTANCSTLIAGLSQRLTTY